MLKLLFWSTLGFANLNISPSFYNFGRVQVGYTQMASFTVLNNSEKNLNSVYVNNSCSSDFRMGGGCSGYIPAHGSCYFTVNFHPMFKGFQSCHISASSELGTATATLSGEGYKN